MNGSRIIEGLQIIQMHRVEPPELDDNCFSTARGLWGGMHQIPMSETHQERLKVLGWEYDNAYGWHIRY